MRSSAEFTLAVRSGSRAGASHLVVHLLLARRDADDPSSDRRRPTPAEPARVGFVVSKAVGNAVQRNLVKRRLRALVADRLGDVEPGAVAVIRALPAAREASYEELRADLDRCLDVAARKARRRRLEQTDDVSSG